MTLPQFYLTMLTLLAAVLTAAACLSTFFVSRNRMMLYASLGFLFYFADIAFVLQDTFVLTSGDSALSAVYPLLRLFLSLVAGGGMMAAFWAMTLELLGRHGKALTALPPALFVIGSLLSLALLPSGDAQRFWFYTMRSFFLLWIVLYAAFAFLSSKSEVEREKLKRYWKIGVLLFVMSVAVAAEDARYFLFRSTLEFDLFSRSLTPDRNYLENLFMIACCLIACRSCFQGLSLRFDRPPRQPDDKQKAFIDDNVLLYAKRYQLSNREQEVLRMLLVGKDNQNIASEMQVALSTVKAHVHHILQKTGQANRQELVRDFWKNS